MSETEHTHTLLHCAEVLEQLRLHEELLDTVDGLDARQHLELKYSPRYVDRVVGELEHTAECAARVRSAADTALGDGVADTALGVVTLAEC